jgi:dipeptidyl aminopeptidase/acylaminoacyl peptidase
MHRRAIAVALIGLAVAAAIGAFAFLGDYLTDPPSASCSAAAASFDPAVTVSAHQEIAVHFRCEGALQSGTLYLPRGAGPHPAVVWIHGAGPSVRLAYAGFVASLVDAGVGVLSYDKRGSGESEGTCCPGDNGHFNLLSADAVGAVSALASREDVRRDEIGLIGASQAGWIAPKVAVASHNVAFIALASATPLTERHVNLYERLAAGEQGNLTKEEISRRLAASGPSGYDPLPFLKQLSIPSLWLFGTADDRIPVDESVALLDRLKQEGKDITAITFAGAKHGLLDDPPSDPKAPTTLVEWIVKRVHP